MQYTLPDNGTTGDFFFERQPIPWSLIINLSVNKLLANQNNSLNSQYPYLGQLKSFNYWLVNQLEKEDKSVSKVRTSELN